MRIRRFLPVVGVSVVLAVGVGACGDGGDDADADPPAETWYDPASRLLWQNLPDGIGRTHDEAIAYCDALSLGGYEDWRLPTISELRSLIRGCPPTETNGLCRVTDDCPVQACFDTTCFGCDEDDGPGTGGAYWSETLGGPVNVYWSSSAWDDASSRWVVYFRGGEVETMRTHLAPLARCVRTGP